VWVADFAADRILVYEPIDYSSFCGVPCNGTWSWSIDEDGDGYKNADELDNGTNPCSAADVPPDNDLDLVSDLLDPDDDNDGRLDEQDPFAIDALDGLGTTPPLEYTWFANQPGHGFFGLGFTGLMANGVDDYLELFEPSGMTAGGAAGVLTVDGQKLGSAIGSLNKQRFGFQFGVAAGLARRAVLRTDARAGAVLQRQLAGRRTGAWPVRWDRRPGQLRAHRDVAGGPDGALEVGVEIDGVYQSQTYPAVLYFHDWVDLRLSVDPLSHTIQPRAAPGDEPFFDVGPPLALPPGSALEQCFFGAPALAVGVMASAAAPVPSFNATWDSIQVQLGGP
jgi:hypothetical protein